MKKLCSLCGKNKTKRICFIRENIAICSFCCATARSHQCEGCSYYAYSNQYQQEKHKNTGRREFVLEIKPELEEELNRALELIDAGKSSDAQRILDKIARTDPHYYLFNFARGAMYIKQKKLDDAIACFDRATAKFPDFVEAYFNKGMAHKEKLDVPNMVQAFREVLKCGNPDDEIVRWTRNFLKDMERKIIKTEGINLDTYLKADDIFNEAGAFMNREEWTKAIDLFKQCISLNPKNPKSYGNMGICYGKLGNKKEALVALDKAIELDPDYEPALLNRKIISQLEEGEALPGGPVKSVEYTKDYELKKKSLIRELYETVKGS